MKPTFVKLNHLRGYDIQFMKSFNLNLKPETVKPTFVKLNHLKGYDIQFMKSFNLNSQTEISTHFKYNLIQAPLDKLCAKKV